MELLEKIKELKKLERESDDPELKQMAREESKKLSEESLSSFPQNRIILEIRPGTGGDEAELFAGELARMYLRFTENQGLKALILSEQRSSLGGIREVVMAIEGEKTSSLFKYEGGIHRVQRIPQTEKAGRIHTSAATVAVLPEVEEREIKIDPKDLKIEVFRASGHGGQSVNTTDSAVRIHHKPSGITAVCQDERSQLKNKEKAMRVLRARLAQRLSEKETQTISKARREMVGTGDRSEKIRTYNFPQDRITDHRINKSFHKIKDVLDGNLNPIIKALRNSEIKKIMENA